MSKHVRARAPLRISLAGGGTDIKEFSDIYGGAVLNIAITKYAFADIELIEDGFIAKASDLKEEIFIKIDNADKFPNTIKNELILHWHTYKYVMDVYNDGVFLPSKIITYCDSPMGSGLGSSSALVVCMLKGWSELLNLGLDEYVIARNAIQIERGICRFEGGQQDQYSAAFGGINFIEFNKDNNIVHPLKIKKWFKNELETSLLLHFTGISRFSGQIINDQIKIMQQVNKEKIIVLNNLRDNAFKMKNAFLKNSTQNIIELLRESRILKSSTSHKIESNLIKERIQFGLEEGALCAKVSGAGGGGFILFFTDPINSILLREKLRGYNENTFLIQFCDESSQAWSL